MTRSELRELIEMGAVDFLQPDFSISGRLTEMRKTAALTSAFGLRLEPHVW